MAYDVIKRLNDTTLTSKQQLVAYLLNRTRERKSNEKFQDSIFNFLSEKEKITYSRTFGLISPKYALGCLTGHFIYHNISEDNFNKQTLLLKKLSIDLEKLTPSPNALLRKTAAIKLIDTVLKFGLPEYFLRACNNRPLRIYFIPYKHAKLNAGYLPYLNSIVSYRPKKKESSPEYIFVHEIGHQLIFNLTGNPDKVPNSFVEFNKKYNPSWKGDLVEVFVDLFPIAIMMETEFAFKNPFLKTFSIKHQIIVRDYFKSLISDLTGKDIKSWFGIFEEM